MRIEQRLFLTLSSDELAAARAAVATAEEAATTTLDAERLRALRRHLAESRGAAGTGLYLEPEDASLLRAGVTQVMAMRGYIVGRPQAINALVSLRRKLDRLLS